MIRNRIATARRQPAGKIEQATIVKTIGQRMRQARELCNLSQVEAARRFGYSNPSKLSKIEGATDTNSVPLWIIVRAASMYEVSIDFLFGASDDWETGARMTQEREVSQWMFNAWESSRRRDIEILRLIHNKVQAMDESVAAMVSSGTEAQAALARFRELNPDFIDMRAGSRLENAVDRVKDSAESAKAKMKRFRCEISIAATDTNQLKLFSQQQTNGS